MSWVLDLLPLIGSGVSLASCLWFLLRCLPRVHKKYSQKLLMRQLRHLAIADSFVAIMACASVVPQLAFFPNAKVCDVWTDVLRACVHWPLAMSVLVEAQVAVSFLSMVRRCPRILKCVACSLPFMWVLALAIAILDESFVEDVYFPQTKECSWVALAGHEPAPVLFGFIVVLMIMNTASYVALVAECRCMRWETVPAGSVEDKARQQGLRYLVVAVVTWAPHCLVLALGLVLATGITPAFVWAQNWVQVVTATATSLNGALNCWAYALHSRHVKHLYKTADARASGKVKCQEAQACGCHSFHVTFATDVKFFGASQCCADCDADVQQALDSGIGGEEELPQQWMWHSPKDDLTHPVASPC